MTSGGPGVSSPPGASGTWCCELEISGSQGLRALVEPEGQRDARILVRLHGEPLGYLTQPLPPGGLEPGDVVPEAMRRFGDRIAGHLEREGVVREGGVRPPAATERCPNRVQEGALVSVVVCTRNRSAILLRCLERLAELTYRDVEILVVDNAPADDSTRRVVEKFAAGDHRFRYVREPVPGLSAARNRGLAEARGRYVAYTDDDVAVDAAWIEGLLTGFRRRPDAGCVTGLVCTATINGDAERYFDARASSWSTRCEPQEFDLQGAGRPNALYPYSPGIFGTGANFALDRALVVGLGGFDEALGAGTRTRGGEDLDMFVRVLRAGRAIVYEPAAMVWHHHRADSAALLEQLYGYGTGLSAFVAKCLAEPDTRWEVARRIPLGLYRMAAIRSQTSERLGADVPRPAGALRREFAGFIAGPALYLRARREARARRAGASRNCVPAGV